MKDLKAQDDPSLLFTVRLSFPSSYPSTPLQANVRSEALNKVQDEVVAERLREFIAEVSAHQRECAHEVVEWVSQHLGEILGSTTEIKRGDSGGSTTDSGNETAVVAWQWRRDRAPLDLAGALDQVVGVQLFLGNPTLLVLSGSGTLLSTVLEQLYALDPPPSYANRFKGQVGLELKPGITVTPPRPVSSVSSTSSTSSSSSLSISQAPPLSSIPFTAGSMNTKVLQEVLARLRVDLPLEEVLQKEYFRVYTVRLVTGNGRHCGTSGQITVEIVGEWGHTEESDFPPGAMKTGSDLSMNFNLLDVGNVDFVVLRNKDTTPWSCSMVQISTPTTTEALPAATTKRPEYTCHIHREWIKLGHSKIAYFSK